MTDLNFEGLTDSQLRLFAVRCVRRVQHLMTDPRSVAVLDVAERHARNEATDAELKEAAAAGWAAAWDAASAEWAAADAARAAARVAPVATGSCFGCSAARAAARAAADAVERAAADAARTAAWEAERAEQQKILDEIRGVKP